MNWSAENRLFYIHAIFLGSLCVFGLLFFKTNQTSNDTARWVDHTHDVLFQSEKVLAANNDLQIVVQELLSGMNNSALVKLTQKSELVLWHVSKLRELTSDNDGQQKRIKTLQDLLKGRLHYLHSFKSGDVGAQVILESETRFLRSIWKVMEAIQKEEDRLLSIRKKANDSSREALNIIFYGSLVVGGIVLFITFSIARKYISLRQRILHSVSEKNEVLEKRVEQNMHEIGEQETRYHLVLDNMLEGAQIIDYNWKYLYANAAVARQAHYTIEQLLGAKMHDLYPGIENTPLFEALNSCMLERTPRKIENHFQYPDGEAAYYEVSIEPIKEGLFVLTMDITDRKIREIYKEQYISELEEVLFKISHEVRSPVVKILGVAQLLELSLIDTSELPMVINEMKKCAVLLDKYTRDLSDFVTEIRDHSAADAAARKATNKQ